MYNLNPSKSSAFKTICALCWIIQDPLGTRLYVQKHVFRTYPQKMEVAVHGAVTKKRAVT